MSQGVDRMTENKEAVEKRRLEITEEKEMNTLISYGWQREEPGKPNVVRHESHPNRTEYTFSDKRKKPHTEWK
mgnify:CR=1 FL=1